MFFGFSSIILNQNMKSYDELQEFAKIQFEHSNLYQSHSLSENWRQIVFEFTSTDSIWYKGLDEFQRDHLNIHLKTPIFIWTFETLFWIEHNIFLSLTNVNVFERIRRICLSESAYVLDELVNIINMSIESDQNHHKFHRWLISFTKRTFRMPNINDIVLMKKHMYHIIQSYTQDELCFYKQLTMKKLLKLIVIETRCSLYSTIPFSTYSSLKDIQCSSLIEIQDK